jgi:ribosomal protein S21
MFRALSKSSTVVAALAQRQVTQQTRVQGLAAFHSSSAFKNNTTADLLSSLSSTKNSNNSNNNNRTSSLFGNASSRSTDNNRSDISLFGLLPPKANTTANPIHLDTNHPTEGRSFRVGSPATVDQTYRRLRSALNQSNMKRELRLRRTYETGHVKMRREKQEQNKKLFGAMVRKKIELIKLMKIRWVSFVMFGESGFFNRLGS